MPKEKEIALQVRKLIVEAVQKKIPYSQISQLYGVSKSSVARIIDKWNKTKSVANNPRSGRPRITTVRQDRILTRLCKNDPRLSSVQLNGIMAKSYQMQCSVSTTKRRLRSQNLFGRRSAKKPLISLKNRIARIKFAKEHLNWTVKDWSKILWTDESKFMMFGTDGIKFIRRPKGKRYDPKYQLPTVKHGGGNVMVWGCFSRDMVSPIYHIDGIMDQVVYLDIIKKVMLPHAKQKMPRGWILQQDNDPKHRATSVKNFFGRSKIRVMEWPSQSPDLNPIEHLWEHVDCNLQKIKPKNKTELFQNIKKCWSKIPIDVLIKLVDSMPARCKAVIDSKGYPTKY